MAGCYSKSVISYLRTRGVETANKTVRVFGGVKNDTFNKYIRGLAIRSASLKCSYWSFN